MKYKFPASTFDRIHREMQMHTIRDKKEISMPLCSDKNNVVKVGEELVKGEMGTVKRPKGECGKDRCIGSFHTHPEQPPEPDFLKDQPELKKFYGDIPKNRRSEDTEYFPELEYLSEGDLFGVISGFLKGEIKDKYVTCSYEKRLDTPNKEKYAFVCERFDEVTTDEIRKIKRTGTPSKKVIENAPEYENIIAYSVLKDYPWGENIPESVIEGLTITPKDFNKAELEMMKKRNINPDDVGQIYPTPEAQKLKNWRTDEIPGVDVPTEILSYFIKRLGPDEGMALFAVSVPSIKEKKAQLWRKADAVSVKTHLFKEGKIKIDSAIITCNKVKIGRKGKTIKKCDFKDEVLDL